MMNGNFKDYFQSMEFELLEPEENPPNPAAQDSLVDLLSGQKTHSFEDLSVSIKTLLLSTNKNLSFAAFSASNIFEYIIQKLQDNLTVFDILLHDISSLLRLFFDLETFIKSHQPLENKVSPIHLRGCTKSLFRHLMEFLGSKEQDLLQPQDHLLIDLLRVILSPPPGFISTLSDAQLISVIEEEISEFKPSIYLALSRIFRFLDKKTIGRLCGDPMELIKGILDSTEDIESPIFHDISRFLYSIHLNPQVQKTLLRSEIYMILYKLLKLPYQDQKDIPDTFHKTRLLCIQIIADCVSVQSESSIKNFVGNLLRSDVQYMSVAKRQLFVKHVFQPLLKIAPLSDLIPVSVHYQPPAKNLELFKNLSQEPNEEAFRPSSLTRDQYEQFLRDIYVVQINEERINNRLKFVDLPPMESSGVKWRWRAIKGYFRDDFHSESCLLIFTCTDISLKFGFYLASPQAHQSWRNCMFYIVDGQFQFLTNFLRIHIELGVDDVEFSAYYECPKGFSSLLEPSDGSKLGSMLFASSNGIHTLVPPNLDRIDFSSRKDIWNRFEVDDQKLYTSRGLFEFYAGYPFYDIDKLQPSYSANISVELIENTTSSDVYLVPKNLSLSTFAQLLFPDSPETVKLLQIERQNGKILNSNTKINENKSTLNVSSSLLEAEVLKHLSASPTQVLQKILNQHPESIQKPLLKPLGSASIEEVLQYFEELCKTVKTQNSDPFRKLTALCNQFDSFIGILQPLLGDYLPSLLIEFLLEDLTGPSFLPVFSMTVLSLIKFQDTFSVPSNQLFQVLESIFLRFPTSKYLKQLSSLFRTGVSQIFFLSDPRVFRAFLSAMLWRTNKDLDQIESLLSFDESLLSIKAVTDANVIQEQKQIWGGLLEIWPNNIDVERLRMHQVLERWTLIFEEIPAKTKSQNLALQVLKILRACIYESLIKFRFLLQSTNLFDLFYAWCHEKGIENPYFFFREASDSLKVLSWTKAVVQGYLDLKFEAYNYSLFLEVLSLPLFGFKSFKSLLLKEFRTDKENKLLQSNPFDFLEFLQRLGSRDYFLQKFENYDINEFYEQWLAVIISLNIPRTFKSLLWALKDQINSNSLKDQLFLGLLELLHSWSENDILLKMFTFEFPEALESCEDQNMPPNLDSFLLNLMRSLPNCAKQELSIQKKTSILQITSKALVLIQKTRIKKPIGNDYNV